MVTAINLVVAGGAVTLVPASTQLSTGARAVLSSGGAIAAHLVVMPTSVHIRCQGRHVHS